MDDHAICDLAMYNYIEVPVCLRHACAETYFDHNFFKYWIKTIQVLNLLEFIQQNLLKISDEEIRELQIIHYEEEVRQFIVLHLPQYMDTFVHHGR